jgi:uncharacterized protein YeaO (DUF488 family)
MASRLRSSAQPAGHHRFMVHLKRAYEKPEPADGVRYLVDRIWPRGIAKAALQIDGWLKDVAPSSSLRSWFRHDASKWDEFRRRYFSELDEKPDSWALLAEASKRGTVTLVYSAHDTEHNNAVALAEYLRKHQN